ncbi:radical SAM protein [Candidatus Marsarchaeota archaeon]|jgi:MoaA/NifB/PqqE/SkfB family radical SAM enzyme|nr:radical SAM protein [Candidatus Marsarchaeota archaeon]MCL5099718.1 radical SAM protein [Candidatus Marsarchaeota archaeon]
MPGAAKFIGLGITALKSNFSSLRVPYKLNFAITYWCQSRCLSCNIWQFKPKGELTLEEIREFARKNAYFKWIELTGGEPFLRPDITEIARAFYETSRGLYVMTIPTNSLCSHEMVVRRVEDILMLGIPKLAVTVSLDGYRELHDKIRGVPGNYDRAIEMFKRLKELGMRHKNLYVVFGYTMSKYNQWQLERTYTEVKKSIPSITRNDFHINVAQVSSNYYGNSSMSLVADSDAMMHELADFVSLRRREFGIIGTIENAFLRTLLQYLKTGKMPLKSRSLDASFFLDSYGNIFPSIMWDRKIASLREINYDVQSVWRGELANDVRREIAEGKEPKQWTACEAFQSLTGRITSLIK